MNVRENELQVIKKSKELSKLIFEITEKSPKKFRFTIVTRLQNCSIEVVSNLLFANDTIVNLKILADYEKTIHYLTTAENSSLSEFEKLKLFELKMAKAKLLNERVTKRVEYSQNAVVKLKEIEWLTVMAKDMNCITGDQYKSLSQLIFEVRRLLYGFVKKDRERYNY